MRRKSKECNTFHSALVFLFLLRFPAPSSVSKTISRDYTNNRISYLKKGISVSIICIRISKQMQTCHNVKCCIIFTLKFKFLSMMPIEYTLGIVSEWKTVTVENVNPHNPSGKASSGSRFKKRT